MLLDPNVPMGGLSDLLNPNAQQVSVAYLKSSYGGKKTPTYVVMDPRYPQNHSSSMVVSADQQLQPLSKEGVVAYGKFRSTVSRNNTVTFPGLEQVAQDLKILADSATFPTRSPEPSRSTVSNAPLTTLQKSQIKGQAQSDFLIRYKRHPQGSEDMALLSKIENELTQKAEQNPSPQIRARFSENNAEAFYKKVKDHLLKQRDALLLEGLQELKAQNAHLEFTYTLTYPSKDPNVIPVSPYTQYDSNTDHIDLASAKVNSKGEIVLQTGEKLSILYVEDIKINPSPALYPPQSVATLLTPDTSKLNQLEASTAKILVAHDLDELNNEFWFTRKKIEDGAKTLREAELAGFDSLKRSEASLSLLRAAENNERLRVKSIFQGNHFPDLNEVASLRWGLLSRDPLSLANRALAASQRNRPHFEDELTTRKARLYSQASSMNFWKAAKPWGISTATIAGLVGSAYMLGSTFAPQETNTFLDAFRIPLIQRSGSNNSHQLPSLSGNVGSPTNSGSEGDPSSPDYNAKTHFLVKGPPDSLNEFFYNGTQEELKDSELWQSKHTRKSSQAVSLFPLTAFEVTNSYISISTLKDHELSDLMIIGENNQPLKHGVDYEVRYDANKEINGVYFLTSQKSVKPFPTFEPKELKANSNSLPSKLLNLETKKLKEVSFQLRNAKLSAIADALDEKISQGPVGVEEIKKLVSENSIYAHEKEIKGWDLRGLFSTNPFQSFTKFVKSGIACGECDMGNAILAQILRESLPRGFSVRERGVEVANNGEIESIGHVVTEITDDENKSIYRLDATPKTHSSAQVAAMKEFREEVEKKRELEQKQSQRNNDENKEKIPPVEHKQGPPPRRTRDIGAEEENRRKAVAMGPGTPGPLPPSQDPALAKQAKEESERLHALAAAEREEIQIATDKFRDEEEAWKKKWKGPVSTAVDNFSKHYLSALNTFLKPARSKLLPRDSDKMGFHIRQPFFMLSSLNSYLENRSTLEELKSALSISADIKDPATVFQLIHEKVQEQKARLDKLATEMPKLLNEISLKSGPKKEPPPALLRQAAELVGIPYSELSRARIMENINLFGHPEYAGAMLNMGRTLGDAMNERPTSSIPQPRAPSERPVAGGSCKDSLQ